MEPEGEQENEAECLVASWLHFHSIFCNRYIISI